MKEPSVVRDNSKGIRGISDLQKSLADYILRLDPGDKLPSVAKLASLTRMSVGSVSTALNDLQTIGAVKIQKHGHQGSVLESVSIGKIWNLMEQGPFVIALSLPVHSHFEGLATALKSSVEKLGIETYLIFIRGSNTRLKALRDNRCHVSILSGLAAEESGGKKYEILYKLPPGTWISGYSVFYRDPLPVPGRPLRVAVDYDSYDHRRVSELEFADYQVEFKHASFIQFPRLIRLGEVDALLWNNDQEDSFLGPGIAYRPLSKKVQDLIGDRAIAANIVGLSDRPTVREVIKAAINEEAIVEIQRKIVSGELIPEY